MVASAILAVAAMQFRPWLTFIRWPSGPEPTEIIEVDNFSGDRSARYLLRRTVIKGKFKSVWWTDTNKCPAAKLILSKAQNLTPPRIHIPFLGSPNMQVSIDGIRYEIKGLANYPGSSADDISFSSNTGTPLAKWVDESLKALSRCWAKNMPIEPK